MDLNELKNLNLQDIKAKIIAIADKKTLIKFGISFGSFCKSLSIVTIISPFEFLIPASNDAVCPKFFLNFIILIF